MKPPLSKRILIGVTGKTSKDWEEKLLGIEKNKINEFALFLEMFNKKERRKIYSALLSMNAKRIPFVHIKNEMEKFELKLLQDNFGTEYFNMHENSFPYINRWEGFHKKILVEFNYNNKIPPYVHVEKMGGFCIDLSHFKASQILWTSEFEYIYKRKKHTEWFIANHLNGFDPVKIKDKHTITSIKDFDYLKTLPKFLFGKYIVLEVFNSINEQILFKEYLIKLLKGKI